MDKARAAELLGAERARVEGEIAGLKTAGRENRAAERETGDYADPATALTSEGVDDALLVGLQNRLDAVGRAEERLADGTFGLSVRSGLPIPDERLEADPAAELTVEEASDRHAD